MAGAAPAGIPGRGILPDDRGYELVTPALKGDSSFVFDAQPFEDGLHVAFNALLPLPGAVQGGIGNLLATRSTSGWQSTQLNPPQGDGAVPDLASPDNGGNASRQVAFTADFSSVFLNTWTGADPTDQDQSASDAYERLQDGSFTMVSHSDQPGPETGGSHSVLAGISADGAHALFQTPDNVPNATVDATSLASHVAGDLAYDRTGGRTRLVGVLPDGTVPACGAVVGGGAINYGPGATGAVLAGSVSSDGSRVVFTSPDPGAACPTPTQVYLRLQGTTTVAVSAPAPGAPIDVTRPATYLGSSDDARQVYFTSAQRLTPDAPPSPAGPPTPQELYRYDLDTGQLTRISRGTSGTAAGDLHQDDGIAAVSADGSRVFFTAHGALAPGAISGERNLFLFADGQTTLIPGAGVGLAASAPGSRVLPNAPQTTPSGSTLLFLDSANLTSYDSGGHVEAYRYDVASASIACVSCNPTGAPAQGDAQFVDPDYVGLNQLLPPVTLMSADGGRVFFETTDALVPRDGNRLMDVYQWHDGVVSLLSSGTDPNGGGERNGSHVIGVGDDGDDVFFLTADRLVPQDTGTSFDIYDARVGGGFPAPAPPVDCFPDCQGDPAGPPAFATSTTSHVLGARNVPPPPFSLSRLTARMRTRLARGRAVTLAVEVRHSGTVRAAATAQLGGRRVNVARASKTARRAGTVRVALRLSSTARRQLARQHKLTVRLVVSFGGASKRTTLRLAR